ncbi:MAG: rod shape-determining protein RodA, partial [Bacteroidota bacterium]
MKNQSVTNSVDWITILLYIVLACMGWMTIYSASLPNEETSFFDLGQVYGKQILFMVGSIPLIIVVLSIDAKIFDKYAFIFYGGAMLLLAGLFVLGTSHKGQTNWYSFAGFSLQPSEFAKIATALVLSKYLSDVQINLQKINHQLIAFAIIFAPVMLIMMQPDAGSAMIFMSLIFVLYREGLPGGYIIMGFSAIALFLLALLVNPIFLIIIIIVALILHYLAAKRINRNPIVYSMVLVGAVAFVLSVNYVFENVLEEHQKDRINVLFGKEVDLKAEGYNLNQAQIAIGSGGWLGKGYLEGTQTKGGFVPEQHTDYIFTTVGEEWGFIGS